MLDGSGGGRSSSYLVGQVVGDCYYGPGAVGKFPSNRHLKSAQVGGRGALHGIYVGYLESKEIEGVQRQDEKW